MIDAAASFIDVNDSMRTSSFLRDIDLMVEREQHINTNNNNMSASNFVITEEEKAKIECLKGQVLKQFSLTQPSLLYFLSF